MRTLAKLAKRLLECKNKKLIAVQFIPLLMSRKPWFT
jgi:hypothetical protein